MNKLQSTCAGFFLLLGITATSRAANNEPRSFSAGSVAVDVTPRLPISLNGGMADRKARTVHDPLHARCLVLDDGAMRVAVVVVDSCMVPDDVVADAKRRIQQLTGISENQVIVSATHTHTAPTLAPSFQSDPDPEYVRELPKRIAEGVQQAILQRRPAQLAWATADVPHQVFNRRWFKKPGSIPPNPFGRIDGVQMNPAVADPNLVEPAGPTDPQVVSLFVRSQAGQPIALLANYSLHYVGDVPGDSVSADYYGAYAAKLRSLLNAESAQPPFVGIMSNGTSGNINNINFRAAHPKLPVFGRIQTVAGDVAKATAFSLQNANACPDPTIKAAHCDLKLGVRKPSAEEIRRAGQILETARGRSLQGLAEIYARETMDMSKYPDEKSIRIQSFRIGDVGIVAIPCEVFVEIGLAIKQTSPLKPTFTISLANGYSGYLPTPEHHRLGGYETWRAKSSFLETDAAPKIQAAALELLNQVAAR